MIKIKSFIATSSMLVLLPADGSDAIRLAGADLVSSEDVLEMMTNIANHGETPFINKEGKALSLLEMALQLSLDVTEEQGELVVTTDVGDKVAVTEMRDHIEHAIDNELNNLPALIQHIKGVKVKHVAEDLVKFITRSDMPITTDGMIIGFRRNRRTEAGVFDGYTGKIPQFVGSTVEMEVDMVNASRDACNSAGLHVASRNYFRSYTGNTAQLVLVHPHDIVAVPYSDATKMRVSKYHIVHELTNTQFTAVIDNNNFAVLDNVIASLVAGNIPSITKNVHVSKKGVTVTDVVKEAVVRAKAKKVPVVTPRDKVVRKLDVGAVNTFGQLLKLHGLFCNSTYNDKLTHYHHMLLIKRKQKKSWSNLGFGEEAVKGILKFEKDNKEAIKGI